MRFAPLRSLCVAVVVFGLPAAASSQQKPTVAQAQELLKNPAMVQQLKDRLLKSGLTPDQVRSRLRAEGYPENLLDPYLVGGTGSDTSAISSDVFSAVKQLGVVDSMDIDLIHCGIDPDSVDTSEGVLEGNMRKPLDPDERLAMRQRLLAGCQRQDSTASPEDKFPADSGFKIFGLDFFRRPTTQFQPNLNGPVDASYRFGPGDKLVLVLTGDVEESYTLDVTREGFIVIPQVGQLYINNLTLTQLEDLLYSRLSRVYSGVRRGAGATTHFSVSPAKLRSNLIYVTGDVVQPGAYQVSSAGTVLNALYAAGGPNANGSMRHVEVRRDGKLIGTLDLYDYLIRGDASGDLRLQNGDIVFIPVHLPRVRIVGAAVRPATYEIKPTESLADALKFAGGFNETASRRRVQIERIVPPSQRANGRDRITTDIVSDAFADGYGPSLPVAPGDVIRIFAVSTRMRNRITVTGNVNQPGPQGVTPGMTLSTALRNAGGVKSDTYLGRVLISRLQPDATRIQLRAELRDTTGAVVNDLTLQEDDDIHVFSQTEFRPDRYVAINGAVHKSGRFPYREGMTVRDLILLAGGLEQSALLNTARIARIPDNRSDSRMAREFEVPLDSSYLFERGADGRYAGPPGLPGPAGPSPDVELKPYDNVLVLRQPDWALLRTVAVEGEVRFPGKYTLLSKNERITDVLKRAGGLTNEGYANGVTFVRKNGVGRIGIDLPSALRDPKYRDNLLLQDGDSVFIPRFSSVVSVTGAVNSPVAVSYVPGRDLNYYIRAAGGPKANADDDRAYVTQPNGKVDAKASRFLLPNYVPVPQPGSTIYVPQHDDTYKPTDRVALAGAIAGILSSLVAVTIAITR